MAVYGDVATKPNKPVRCTRCGDWVPQKKLIRERITGIRVCPECLDIPKRSQLRHLWRDK